MKLHIFNPDHDMALANDSENFIPPHTVKVLREDLGFLPALWSQDGDIVLVDDVDSACHAINAINKLFPSLPKVKFVSHAEIRNILSSCEDFFIQPWGWDKALRKQLINDGISAKLMPSDSDLMKIREISCRQWTAEKLLPQLVPLHSSFIGEMSFCADFESLNAETIRLKRCLCKSLWSSSGRGLRLMESSKTSNQTVGWIKHIIAKQGGVIIEPFYQKVVDFAMEFYATTEGIKYLGVSLFSTLNGAYSGNIIKSENSKNQTLCNFISSNLLDVIRERIIMVMTSELPATFRGPFGVDMMIVSDSINHHFYYVHPCVELNFRMTMGHVALALCSFVKEEQYLMHINFDGTYRLVVEPF